MQLLMVLQVAQAEATRMVIRWLSVPSCLPSHWHMSEYHRGMRARLTRCLHLHGVGLSCRELALLVVS